MKHFPVMHAKKLHAGVLINVRDIVLVPDLFVTVEEENENVGAASGETVNDIPTEPPQYGPQLKRGRKPLHELYPNLVPLINEFIKEHSFSAHNRRRETTGTGIMVMFFVIYH